MRTPGADGLNATYSVQVCPRALNVAVPQVEAPAPWAKSIPAAPIVSTSTLLTAPVAVAVTVTPRAAEAIPTGWLPNCACAAAAISSSPDASHAFLSPRRAHECLEDSPLDDGRSIAARESGSRP